MGRITTAGHQLRNHNNSSSSTTRSQADRAVVNSSAIRDSIAAIAITVTTDVAAAINVDADSVVVVAAGSSSNNSRVHHVGIRDSVPHLRR